MDSKQIELQYQKAKNTPSDINEHMEVLYAYAKKCRHITEMGTRTIVSTWAFLKAKPDKYVGYDMFQHPNMNVAVRAAKEAGIDIEFLIGDVLDAEIDETDFLFIDTFHTASQLEKELKLHADKAKKFIGFHDTFTFWETGEQPYEGMGGKGVDCGRGLKYALEPFLKANPQWTIAYKTDRNNGLTIIQRA